MDLSILTQSERDAFEKINKFKEAHPLATVEQCAKRTGVHWGAFYKARQKLGLSSQIRKTRESIKRRSYKRHQPVLTTIQEAKSSFDKVGMAFGTPEVIAQLMKELMK